MSYRDGMDVIGSVLADEARAQRAANIVKLSSKMSEPARREAAARIEAAEKAAARKRWMWIAAATVGVLVLGVKFLVPRFSR